MTGQNPGWARLWPWRGEADPAPFFHDLHCRSGFGDRMTDTWAAVTVARLHESETRVAVHWNQEGNEYPGFVGNYTPGLFSIAGCEFVPRPPWRASRARGRRREFSDCDPVDRCLVQLTNGIRQIVLRSGREWGNNCPDRVFSELRYYGLDPVIGPGAVVDTYRAVANDTEPASPVVEGIPDDIGGRLGIHVRLTDKLLSNHDFEVPFEMSSATWNSIEARGLRYIEDCIQQGERFFVCSDDLAYRTALMERIRSRGGDVLCADPPRTHRHLPGYPALVDFFSLARCARVVQMTKYSTFSIAAALVGGTPLVNFYRTTNGVGNRLDIWKSVLTQVISADSDPEAGHETVALAQGTRT